MWIYGLFVGLLVVQGLSVYLWKPWKAVKAVRVGQTSGWLEVGTYLCLGHSLILNLLTLRDLYYVYFVWPYYDYPRDVIFNPSFLAFLVLPLLMAWLIQQRL